MTFGPYRAVVASLHDGDTLRLDVLLRKQLVGALVDEDLGFDVHRRHGGIWLVGLSVRVYGIDAPELATDLGKQALAYAATIVKTGDAVHLVSHGWDKYGGRVDGDVALADGSSLAQRMLDSGLARPYHGTGPKPWP